MYWMIRFWRWFRTEEDDVANLTVKSAIWSFLLRFIDRGLGLVRTLILARLLAPSDFGLFAVAFLVLSGLESFTKPGFQESLIQQDDPDARDLDTAWTVQILRGGVLALVLTLGAPWVADFFGSPMVRAITIVIGVGFFLQSFRNIGMVLLRKELDFETVFYYDVLATLANISLAITVAWVWSSVWALVLGLFVEYLARLILSYALHPFRPKIRLNLTRSLDMFRFGRWILGSSMLVFLLNQGDDLFVGKVLGVAALGFYQMAYRFSNVPATEIGHVISKVTFPAFSKIKDDLTSLRKGYLQTLTVVTCLTFPVGGGIIILGEEFTRLILGAKWLPMVGALQILAVWGIVRSIGSTTSPLFRAVGRPDYSTKIHLVKITLLIVCIYPFTVLWGIAGTASAVVLNALVANPIADYLVVRTLRCPVRRFLLPLFVPLTSTATMMAYLWGIDAMSWESGLLAFGLKVLSAAGIYWLGIYLLDRWTPYRLGNTLRERFFNLGFAGRD